MASHTAYYVALPSIVSAKFSPRQRGAEARWSTYQVDIE